MKIIITPMLLKLNLVLIFIVFASGFEASGQTTSQLATPINKNVRATDQSSSPFYDAAINEYSTAVHRQTPQSRPMVAPFDCEDGLVFIISNTVSSNGLISGLYSYNLSTKTQTVVKDPLVDSKNSSQFINGIGYNVVDNYIYGLLQGTDQVVKMDATGAIEYLTVKGDFQIGDYSSGDVDKNGFLYLYGKKKFISINLNSASSDFMVAKSLLDYSTTVHDIAFSPIDDNIYMMTSTGSRTLLRFNTSTNTITSVGKITGLEAETTHSFGTAFMDSVGNLYVSNNNSGNIYKISSPHTDALVATPYNTISGIPGDGARCPNQVVPSNANDDLTCLTKGEVTTIDLIENDGSGSYPIDLSTIQLIDPVDNARSTSVTVAGQGNFKVDNLGILTFTPEDNFSEAAIQYTFLDAKGMASNIATISFSVNSTPTPTGPSVQEFCQTDGLTLADLEVSGNSIKWYKSESSTTALPMSTPITQDATYYATQTESSSCESLERLAVTVKLKDQTVLLNPEIASCINKRTAYIVEATFKGTGNFSVDGPGAPGEFTDNGNDTTTWISNPINASVLTYDIEITGSNGCDPVVLSGDAPVDCLSGSFECEDGLAFILTNTGTSEANYVTGLYTLNLSTNVQSLVKYPLVEDTTSSQFINAIGYNTLDDYLYGLLQGTRKIVRIDNNGDIEYFDIIGNFDTGYYSSGDVAPDGTLYLYNGSKFVSINLDPTSSNYLEAVDLVNFSQTINDLAYSVVDNNLYMVTSTGSPKLLRYDISTNAVTDVGTITGLEAEATSSFGTAFMDSMGNLLIANNHSGNIYQIATPHTGNVQALFYSGAMEGLQPGDGARCPNQITFPIANDDSVCGPNDSDTLIEVTENDGQGTFALDLDSVQLLDPDTSAPVTSVEVSGQGTFTMGSNGEVTFTPEATFTEASVTYTIMDVMGNTSQPATVTIYLNDTEVPTGDSEQVFCSSSNPTIADLLANGENIQWYDSETSTTSLASTSELINETVYYATQTNAQGCESMERLKVTVSLTKDVTLVGQETGTCDADSATYIVEATFTGTAPFTVTGAETPGTWTDNTDGTFTWVSDAIASYLGYSFEIQDANECNVIELQGSSACCSFEIECPTFTETTVDCYNELPSETSYSVEEFEALGGSIGDSSCGILEIAASNSADDGNCSQTVTRTYFITEYEDTNNNGVRDADENTVLNTAECVQLIKVEDKTAPSLVTEFDTELNITCASVPTVPNLVFEDGCSNDITVDFNETSTDTGNSDNYIITRTWTVSDVCGNDAEFTQTINVNTVDVVAGTDTELCNDDDIDFDLFNLLSGTYDTEGTWTVVSDNATLDGSIFNPYQLDLGTYTFKYTVEDAYCPTETLVNITLNDDCVPLSCGAEDVVISKAVTTYADGKNDFFTITGVETCGFTYEVQIFNRWGALVYESDNYQNDWNGTSSKGSIGGSNYVPTGTYYYVVNLKNSGLKPFAGPIYVATK